MTKPSIFYHCYDHNRPAGGQKDTYKHVDILNRFGLNAYVLHRTDNFRLTWFDNDTRVISFAKFKMVYDPTRDIIVLPEDLGEKIGSWPGRKVIFDKNIYYGFNSLGLKNIPAYPYLNPSVIAAFAVSDHNCEHLRFTYSPLQVFRMFTGIRTELFRRRPLSAKKPQIACIPKVPSQLATVYHMVQARGRASQALGFPIAWHVIRDLTERQVADLLAESLVFVFLNVDEGLPQAVLEASLSGCVVIGYWSGAMKECLRDSRRIPFNDPISICTAIEEVFSSWPHSIDKYEHEVLAAYQEANRYSPAHQAQSVMDAWESILTHLS